MGNGLETNNIGVLNVKRCNTYIRRKDDECTCRSLSTNPCNYTDSNIPIITRSQVLVLFPLANLALFHNL